MSAAGAAADVSAAGAALVAGPAPAAVVVGVAGTEATAGTGEPVGAPVMGSEVLVAPHAVVVAIAIADIQTRPVGFSMTPAYHAHHRECTRALRCRS